MSDEERQKEFWATRFSPPAFRIKPLSDGSIVICSLGMEIIAIADNWDELQKALVKQPDDVLHMKPRRTPPAVETLDDIGEIEI